jgi:futalosine hydrolase
MKSLIVTATLLEVKPLIESAKKLEQINSKLSRYQIKDKEFDLLCTGVGMVATAFHIGITLGNISYDRVINIGIAGSFDKNISIGDVVEITQDQFSEMGAENGTDFLSLLDLKLVQANDFPFESGVLKNEQTLWKLNYPKVKAITVNKVHGNDSSINNTQKRFKPQIESMEGAAFFYACHFACVPCVQLRSISNYVEKRNKESWNMSLAIKAINNEIINLIS